MRKHVLLVLIIASLLLAACGGAAPQATPTAGVPAATETTATEAAPAAEAAGLPAVSYRSRRSPGSGPPSPARWNSSRWKRLRATR